MRRRSAAGGPRRRLRVEDAVSAGGIVYRRGELGLEVALCGKPADNLWVLPKGTPQDAETLEQTALREVQEETGLEVAIERRIGQIEYWFSRVEQGVRFHKIVHHFLMVPVGGDVSLHDREYDVVRWFPVGDAEAVLSYVNELEMLRRAQAMIGGEPGGAQRAPATRPETTRR